LTVVEISVPTDDEIDVAFIMIRGGNMVSKRVEIVLAGSIDERAGVSTVRRLIEGVARAELVDISPMRFVHLGMRIEMEDGRVIEISKRLPKDMFCDVYTYVTTGLDEEKVKLLRRRLPHALWAKGVCCTTLRGKAKRYEIMMWVLDRAFTLFHRTDIGESDETRIVELAQALGRVDDIVGTFWERV